MKSIDRITLDTNPELCNLHCYMCEEHSYLSKFKENLYNETGIKQRLMPIEWIEKIISQAKILGVKEIIPSTMGEPLLYEHFETILKFCKQYEIKLNLTTNGTFPKKSVSEWANLLIPNTTDIKISLNGATKETAEKIMFGLNFNQQIENINILAKIRNEIFENTRHYCSLSFQLTFLQNNMQELNKIIKLAAELDIDRIKGHHVWTHYKELENLSFKKSNETIKLWNNYVEQAYLSTEKFKRKNGEKIILVNIIPLNSNENSEIPENYECPFLNHELWISATGEISPCCAPDNLRKSLGNFGNIKTKELFKIIEGFEYKDLSQNYKQKTLCKTCHMRKPLSK